MVTCPRCGANIDPSAIACPYCRTQTPYGAQQAAHQAAHQYHAARAEQVQRETERQARRRAIETKSKHALYWSLGGALTCCFPAAIIGVVMGLNAKSLAKQQGDVAPGASTVAVVLGGLGIALFGVIVALGIRDSRATDARIAALQAQVEPQRASAQLEQRLACSIVELELLREGYDGKGGISIGDFQCDGKLEQNGESATLRDVRFRAGSEGKKVVAACLSRGARWSVKELRDDGSCEPRAPPAPSVSAR